MPLIKLSGFIEKNIDFATCSSYWRYNYNPNFIISKKDNIILKRCIDWYVNKYNNKHKYDYWDWSIMNAFTQTLHLENYIKECGVYKINDMRVQIIKEVKGKNHYDDHNIYNNIRVFNNRQQNWNSTSHKFN
jgi:hypothetical protein